VTDRAGLRRERSRCLAVERLESRRMLAATMAIGIREFPIPTANSAPFWITSGPGDALFFTAGGANQIGEYNLATHGFTTFSVGTATLGSASFITTGDDGNLYFTAASLNAIEQLNPATHVISSFPIPSSAQGPQFITTGPNGDLYFTTASSNVIEQLDPTTRVFQTFFIPTPSSGATGITTGPNGNLWFVETAANKIAELDPSTNVIFETPIPNTIGGASTIALGADGNLYFTEPGSNSIGQFDPTTHVFRALPIPVANSGAANISAASDGDLDFTMPGVNQMGELNPATLHFAELAIPTVASGVAGITAGPDGNVYFAETSGNKIGEVAIGPAPAPPTPHQPVFKLRRAAILIRTKIATATQLTVAPNPSIVGQDVTLTATVTTAEAATLSGTVTFFIDGQAQPPVPLPELNGASQATLSTKLADGTHVITAIYNGKPNLAASASNAVSVVVAPAPGDGPTVVHLARVGYHSRPTTLVLTFDKALNAASAQNLSNYRITNSQGRSIQIASVAYNPSNLTVTISPAARLNIHRPFELTVIGTGTAGVTDTSGSLLDGALTGEPGSNYVATVKAANLVISG
jgi:virginiamycin B lyase